MHPWFERGMNPDGKISKWDYPNPLTVSAKISSSDFWLDLALRTLGQISYALISSFGLVVVDWFNLF